MQRYRRIIFVGIIAALVLAGGLFLAFKPDAGPPRVPVDFATVMARDSVYTLLTQPDGTAYVVPDGRTLYLSLTVGEPLEPLTTPARIEVGYSDHAEIAKVYEILLRPSAVKGIPTPVSRGPVIHQLPDIPIPSGSQPWMQLSGGSYTFIAKGELR